MSDISDFLNRQKKLFEERDSINLPIFEPVPLNPEDTILAPLFKSLEEIAAHTEHLKELDSQTNLLKKQVEELEKQTVEIGSIAHSANELAEAAMKKATKADIHGWIGIVIAVFGLFLQFASDNEEIFAFVQSVFANLK